MAIGTAIALGLGASALGSFLNKRKGDKDAEERQAYGQQQAQNFSGMMQNGSALQTQGQQMLGGWQMPQAYSPQQIGAQQIAGPSYAPQQFNAAGALGGFGFNTGQDALMQALRTDPTAKSNQALQGIIGGQGNPFDTSSMFKALGVLDTRATNNAVAQTRAGASGLGQRFGSYMARQEGDMRTQANENAAARNAQIQMSSYGDAQQRLLQSIGMLSGNEQFGAGNLRANAQALQSGALSAGQLALGGTQANNSSQAQLAAMQQQAAMANQGAGLQAQQANQSAGLQAAQLNQQGQLQGQQSQAQLLQTLLAAQQAQQAQNTQLAVMSAGMGAPVINPNGWGSTIAGVGQALMAPGVLKSNPTRIPMNMGRF